MALEWVEVFLECLADVPNVQGACRAAGISRQSAYDHRERDPEFARRWQDAMEASTDDLVGEMYRRARKGHDKPVYQGGELIGHTREFSDVLAIFLAKKHRPEVYEDKSKSEVTLQGPGGGPIRFDPTAMTDAELRAIVEGKSGRGTGDPEAGETPTV